LSKKSARKKKTFIFSGGSLLSRLIAKGPKRTMSPYLAGWRRCHSQSGGQLDEADRPDPERSRRWHLNANVKW
jgi:hypothetical protein